MSSHEEFVEHSKTLREAVKAKDWSAVLEICSKLESLNIDNTELKFLYEIALFDAARWKCNKIAELLQERSNRLH